MKARIGVMALLWAVVFSASAFCQSIIIDHTCTDISKVPEESITKAKAMFNVAYGHTSHGSQVVSGMEALRKAQPELFAFGKDDDNDATLTLLDRVPAGDLGGPWAQRTREFLNGSGKDTNLIMWSWCGQVSGSSEKNIETYLSQMNELEKDFPKVKFVYMTGHLDGSGAKGNLNVRNDQIRKFCKENGKTLFDFADIESYDPDGEVNYMALNATDSCNYKDGETTKNWADEWLKKNPDAMPLPAYAAHSRPLNGALKGRAFWWMLARLAGWNP